MQSMKASDEGGAVDEEVIDKGGHSTKENQSMKECSRRMRVFDKERLGKQLTKEGG